MTYNHHFETSFPPNKYDQHPGKLSKESMLDYIKWEKLDGKIKVENIF